MNLQDQDPNHHIIPSKTKTTSVPNSLRTFKFCLLVPLFLFSRLIPQKRRFGRLCFEDRCAFCCGYGEVCEEEEEFEEEGGVRWEGNGWVGEARRLDVRY